MPVQRLYFYGVPTPEEASQIINNWNAHIDHTYAVKRDLGRPQGVNEVCLALQILINFTVANVKSHILIPIAKRAITENSHCLSHALHKMYFELVTSPSQKNALMKILTTELPSYFDGHKLIFNNLVHNLSEKVDTFNNTLVDISQGLKAHIEFPYEFDQQTGLLTIYTKGRAAERYVFSIEFEGIRSNATAHDKIYIASGYKDKVNKFIAFKIITKFLSEWFNENTSQYQNITIINANFDSCFESLHKLFTVKNNRSLSVMRDSIQQPLDVYAECLDKLQTQGLPMNVFWVSRMRLVKNLEDSLSPVIEKIQPGSNDSFELILMIINHLCKEGVSGLNPFSYEFLQLMSDKVWSISSERTEHDAIQFDIINQIQFSIIGKNNNKHVIQGMEAVHTTLQYLIIGIVDPAFLMSAKYQAIKVVDTHSDLLPTVVADLCKLLSDEDKPEFIIRLRKIAPRFTENQRVKQFLLNYSLTPVIVASSSSPAISPTLEEANNSVSYSDNTQSPWSPRSIYSSNNSNESRCSDIFKPELFNEYVNLRALAKILNDFYQEKIDDLLNLQFDTYCDSIKGSVKVDYQACYHLLNDYIELKKMIYRNDAYIYENKLHNHPLILVNQALKNMIKTFVMFKDSHIANDKTYIRDVVAKLNDWHEKASALTHPDNTTVVYQALLSKDRFESLFSHTIDDAILFRASKFS